MLASVSASCMVLDSGECLLSFISVCFVVSSSVPKIYAGVLRTQTQELELCDCVIFVIASLFYQKVLCSMQWSNCFLLANVSLLVSASCKVSAII